MLSVVSLKCASCGSNLEITPEMSSFACGYCGASQIVERHGGTVSLRLIADAITKVQAGTDKTAAELALKRLSKELMEVEGAYDANRQQKSQALESNLQLFGGLWIVGIVICFFIAINGTAAAVFAVILVLSGTVGIIFLSSKQSSAIRAKFDPAEKDLLKQGNRIKDRIAENRALVDHK